MGKRKKAKPPPKKAKQKVATIFDCPFCGKTESCSCKMDVEHSLGTILCDGCGAKFDCRISRLSDPIDVYSEWIDQCDAVNAPGSSSAGGNRPAPEAEEDDDQDF
eukprot:CAMPEP_0174714604 /NCGR_PEP_ID=MMETSP1094-20130205/18613_1 /TAXON_ID=156173 /ORGANISM="Chrysochromulina brevifilum, Strain UTEX LB 985" /LENGTH=104 /DNA_ID=CAMNT_0015913991 /DNA_START=23 /DNA_END=337 /DNA_ORIENTATION=+